MEKTYLENSHPEFFSGFELPSHVLSNKLNQTIKVQMIQMYVLELLGKIRHHLKVTLMLKVCSGGIFWAS